MVGTDSKKIQDIKIIQKWQMCFNIKGHNQTTEDLNPGPLTPISDALPTDLQNVLFAATLCPQKSPQVNYLSFLYSWSIIIVSMLLTHRLQRMLWSLAKNNNKTRPHFTERKHTRQNISKNIQLSITKCHFTIIFKASNIRCY